MPLPFVSGDPIDALASSPESNLVKFIRACCIPMQDIEDALQQLLLERSIDTAVAAQLDVIGKIVQQVRSGDDDSTYRRRIRARIAVHRSTGTFEDLIKVVSLVVQEVGATYVVQQEGTATVRVLIDDAITTDAVATLAYEFLRGETGGAAAAGVRIVVEWLPSTPSGIFRLDSGPGYDVGHLAGDIG